MSFGSFVVIGILAVVLFGKQLPQAARKFGKMYNEFQRSYQAVRREVNSVVAEVTDETNIPDTHLKRQSPPQDDDVAEAVAPKFEPPKNS
ncbi:MAG: twin-arginine translocase TatA/TatE family subunit [Planctomycetia bacterium]|nr:twin-arginine translocase TatA/TatE family subunit [Planctomycetia bacterium]